ncbi:Derlin-1 [Geodia barretti]|nr:Derlin-1 [Geodia barretti]
MLLYFLYSYSTRLETGYFAGKPADYVFMLLFNCLCLVIVGVFMGLFILSSALVFSSLYIWCQINRDVIVQFWFGVKVKAMYFPWVLFLFFFILGADWVAMLLGIVVGHLYFFLTMKYPQEFGGRKLISTPQFLYRYFPNEVQTGGFGVPPVRRGGQAGGGGGGGGGHTWGGGRRLDG